MANPEVQGTVVPKPPEPIVDPIPTLYEQFVKPWGPAWVRPPLKRDGTKIADEKELLEARANDLEVVKEVKKAKNKEEKKAAEAKRILQKESADQWQGSGCQATSLTMLINWLANQYKTTKGKVNLPNRGEDDKSPVDPLHVAYWLWEDGDPDQTKFVDETDHPPYIPYEPEGDSWIMNHGKITTSTKKITLTIAGGTPEPMSHHVIIPKHPTVEEAKQQLRRRDKKIAEREETKKKLDDLDNQIKETSAKENAGEMADANPSNKKKGKKKPTELEILGKERDKLSKNLAYLDAQIAANELREAANVDAVINLQRQRNKDDLKQALLRGPVLMNMTVPSGHYILLFGYRDRMMYILDPGAVIPKGWFGPQEDLEKARGGAVVMEHDSRDILAIDAEAEFEGIVSKKSKGKKKAGASGGTLRFIDNIKRAESYYFEKLPEAKEFNETETPETRAFKRSEVKAKGGG